MSYYAGKTIATLIADTLQKLKQPPLSYDRYSYANILSALNEANVEAATRLKCLHSFAIINLKAGYSQYAPPSQMIAPKCAFFYQTATSYSELPFKSRRWLDRYLPGWRANSSDPCYAFIGDSDGNLRKIGFTPKPKTDGTNYTISPGTGVFVSGTGMTVSGNIIGQNNADHATICTDALARVLATLGVQVGMMALNVNDGSSGQITAVSGSTFTVTLTGGTANTWVVGDSWNVLAGEYGVVTGLSVDDEQYLFTDEFGIMINIQALPGNVWLEFYRRPLDLIVDTQYPEIPVELHQYLSWYATFLLKAGTPKGSTDNVDAATALAIFDSKIPPVSYENPDDAVEVSRIQENW